MGSMCFPLYGLLLIYMEIVPHLNSLVNTFQRVIVVQNLFQNIISYRYCPLFA